MNVLGILFTILLVFFIWFFIKKLNDSLWNDEDLMCTEFKIYLPDGGYKKIIQYSKREFLKGNKYYNLEEYKELLKNKYKSDKIEVEHFHIGHLEIL